MSEYHNKAVEAAIASLDKGASITIEEMNTAFAAYLKARNAVLCEAEPIAHLASSKSEWITGEVVDTVIISVEEHHAAFPVYRSFEDLWR